MNLKTIILLIVSLLAICVAVILLKNSKLSLINDEIPSTNNKIVNQTDNSYYDTIAHYSLNFLGIENQKVIIADLSMANISEDVVDGNVRGGLGQLGNGTYVMFLANMSKDEALTIIPHEIIHLKQFHDGYYINVDANNVIFRNNHYKLSETEYYNRPWEIEAYDKGRILSKELRDSIVRK